MWAIEDKSTITQRLERRFDPACRIWETVLGWHGGDIPHSFCGSRTLRYAPLLLLLHQIYTHSRLTSRLSFDGRTHVYPFSYLSNRHVEPMCTYLRGTHCAAKYHGLCVILMTCVSGSRSKLPGSNCILARGDPVLGLQR